MLTSVDISTTQQVDLTDKKQSTTLEFYVMKISVIEFPSWDVMIRLLESFMMKKPKATLINIFISAMEWSEYWT